MRGVNTANPNKGRLAAQLETQKVAPRAPEARQEERLVVSACSLHFGENLLRDWGYLVRLIPLCALTQTVNREQPSWSIWGHANGGAS